MSYLPHVLADLLVEVQKYLSFEYLPSPHHHPHNHLQCPQSFKVFIAPAVSLTSPNQSIKTKYAHLQGGRSVMQGRSG